MRRSDVLILALTALCWGASFAFIKVAIDDLAPMVVMVLRCTIGAVPMWIAAVWLRRRRGGHGAIRAIARNARERFGSLVALGVLTGIPLWLVALGEEHVDSGLAGIVNASVPLWAALLALRFDAQHRTDAQRIVGVVVGFAGVVLLALARGAIGGGSEALGIATVALAGLMYASSAILVRERLASIPSIEQAAWSITIAAVVFAVPAARAWPTEAPSDAAIASLIALSLLGTFVGFVAYYELLARVGAARATMVTYLLPPLALAYGWALLDERVGIEALAAMGVILAGVWLGSRGRSRPVTTDAVDVVSATASAGPALQPHPTHRS